MLIRFGFMGGMAAGLFPAIWLLLYHSIDLGQNGLVYDRLAFVAWRRFGRHTHLLDDDGNLVLRFWWGRVVAFVPAEQREAVEALLKEKLGDNC